MAAAAERFCDDWSCPQKWSCAHHFCRSESYWAMRREDEDARTFFQGHRTRWGCFDYRQDVPKPWLQEILYPAREA